MSGFLQRLAAHAMGNSNPLHMVTRMPYAATAGDGSTTGAAASTHLNSAENTLNHATAYMPETGIPNQQKQPVAAGNAQAGTQQAAAENDNALISPAEFVVELDQSATSRINMPAPSLTARLYQPEASAVNTPEQLLKPQHNTTPDTRNPNVFHSPPQQQENGLFAEGEAPALLLSPKNPKRTSSLQIGATPQQELNRHAWQSRQENTTEVHVSIGRIEVTAVHEAPAPKRQATTAAKAMTLDAYLARKRREA